MRFATKAAVSGPEARAEISPGPGSGGSAAPANRSRPGAATAAGSGLAGELAGRFRAGPARGKDPVHGLQIRALLPPEPLKFRFAPLGFGTLQVVDQRDDARRVPLPGEVFAEERRVQQFVLQHDIGRPERILGVPAPGVPAPGVPAPGVPAPGVELANCHVVAARPKSLDE